MNAIHGLVTDTIPFSSVDGPGNRFVVFLQGCNFNCVACHNPYTINVCNNCGDCIPSCPSEALSSGHLGAVEWDPSACTGSDACLTACPWDSTPKARPQRVADLLVPIRRAAPFLSGITVSGGEATMQAHFVRALFTAVKTDFWLRRLSCMVDSNGAADPGTWDLLGPVMDGAMIDLKCLDPDIHRAMTGQPNDQVLRSIRQLHAMGKLYEVRLLLVGGINDDPALLDRTAAWLSAIDPLIRLKIIGYRSHGVRPSPFPLREPDPDALADAADRFSRAGFGEVCVV